MAMAARLLCRRRDDLRGRVMFMFQPGEEGPGGAKPMLDEGLLDADGPPDAAFALHIFPNLPSGVLASRPGRVLAAADRVRVTLTGQGGHGSMPHLANDPVPVACELVQAMQTLVTRRFDIFDPVVLTVGRIAAGTVNNVVPETAVMDATLRSFSAEARGAAHDGLRRLADGVAAAHGMTAEVKIAEGYPPTVNDGDFFAFLAGSARNLLGEDAFQEMPNPVMGAEDFSYVLQRVPGAMAFLGVAPEGSDPATAAPCHSNRMLLDEDAMAVGVATHAAVALDFLARG